MAHNPQTGSEGQVWAGLVTTGQVPERLLARNMDNLGQLTFIHRGPARFMQDLATFFPKSRVVKTREPRNQEISELDRKFYVTQESNPANNHKTFGITNEQAQQIQPNDMLYNMNLFVQIDAMRLNYGQVDPATNQVPTPNSPPQILSSPGFHPQQVNFSRIFGADINAPARMFVDNEPMLVTTIGEPDSAGVGSTVITVDRVVKTVNSDFGGMELNRAVVNTAVNNNNNGRIRLDDVLVRGLPSWAEGTGPAYGVNKNVILDVNFSQEFKYAYEQTRESEIERTLMGLTPFQINKMLTGRRAILDMERTFLMGQKDKRMNREGKVQYMTGGVVDYIMRDKDHILKYDQPTLTWPALLDLGTRIFGLGGSQMRTFYTGYTLYNNLKKMFWGSGYMRYDPEQSRDFDVPVEIIEMSGGQVRIVPLYNLEELGWGNRAICIDTGLPSFGIFTHEGWDMKVEKGAEDNGVQIDKEQIIGIKGLDRRYKEYQCIVDFS